MPVRYGLPEEELSLCEAERERLLGELVSVNDVIAGFHRCPVCGKVHRCTSCDPICDCGHDLTEE